MKTKPIVIGHIHRELKRFGGIDHLENALVLDSELLLLVDTYRRWVILVNLDLVRTRASVRKVWLVPQMPGFVCKTTIPNVVLVGGETTLFLFNIKTGETRYFGSPFEDGDSVWRCSNGISLGDCLIVGRMANDYKTPRDGPTQLVFADGSHKVICHTAIPNGFVCPHFPDRTALLVFTDGPSGELRQVGLSTLRAARAPFQFGDLGQSLCTVPDECQPRMGFTHRNFNGGCGDLQGNGWYAISGTGHVVGVNLFSGEIIVVLDLADSTGGPRPISNRLVNPTSTAFIPGTAQLLVVTSRDGFTKGQCPMSGALMLVDLSEFNVTGQAPVPFQIAPQTWSECPAM